MKLSLLFAGTAVVLSLAALAAEARAADRPFAVDGTHTATVTTLSSTTQLVTPDGDGPYPLIVASHGWSASGQQQIGWAKHFATWGFVVAVPTFPSPLTPDTETNSNVIVDLVKQLGGTDAAAHHVAVGKVGLEGHSAGGLATTVAASKLGAAANAVVLFDPVDNADAGKTAYASLCVPLLDVFAQASSCNNQAGWRPFATTTKTSVIGFDVVGSTHCDGENEDRGNLCGFACGGAADPARQAVYAHYATAFFLAQLAGDANAAAALSEASITADDGVASPIRTSATCTQAVDAGADAGVVSPVPTTTPTTSPSPSGSTAPNGAADGAPAAGSDGGCGCRAAGAPRTSGALVAAVAFAILARRRRAR